jgi:formylmethanofuran dehydrogenase subunit C
LSALLFELRAEPSERLDLSPLAPQLLAGVGIGEIERIRLGQSKRGVRVGDVFRIAGDEPGEVVFAGGSSRFDRVAAGMTNGVVRVIGDAGAQAGRKMTGGRLIIEGSTGPHAGSGMRGGRIEIQGNTADHLGAPLAGEMAGMNGGLLVVRGRAGACVADRMRRGLIAVLQGAGELAGYRMIAGTLVVLGGAGDMPGYLMRRGSILLDRMPRRLSPTFIECGAPDSVFAELMNRHLIAEGIVTGPLLGTAPRRYGGDNAVLGKGEIMLPS